jgi:hypothetical protein
MDVGRAEDNPGCSTGSRLSFASHNYQSELFPTRIRSRAADFVYSRAQL